MAREQCQCGADDYEFAIQRVGAERRTYCRCWRCGYEWTVTEPVADILDTISAEEIIDVHALLESNQTLEELIK